MQLNTVAVVTESYTIKHILKDTCGRSIYLWLVQWTGDLKSATYNLCLPVFIPLVGKDQLLTNRIQPSRWFDFCDQVTLDETLSCWPTFLEALLLMDKVRFHDKQLPAASIAETGPWIPARKKPGFWHPAMCRVRLVSGLNELQSPCFSRRASRWEQSLADTLTATLVIKQRIQLSHALGFYQETARQ